MRLDLALLMPSLMLLTQLALPLLPPALADNNGALATTLPVTQIAFSHECETSSRGCLGTPNIVRASATTLLATHDYYSLKAGRPGTVHVWAHTANGLSSEPWRNMANVTGIYWAEFLAVPDSDVRYLLGTSSDLSGVASVVVSKCLDRPCTGARWSTPSVILPAKGGKGLGWHSSGAGAVWSGGRVYRALEALSGISGCVRHGANGVTRDATGNTTKIDLAPVMLSAAASCDLTERSCWTASKPLCYNESWRAPGGVDKPGGYRPWEEATAVDTPSGDVKVIMRLDNDGLGHSCNGAVLLDFTDGELQFSATLTSFPSGCSRFVVRRHGDRYFSLTNPVDANRSNSIPPNQPDPCGQRDKLALAVSSDLIEWKVCEIVLSDDTGLAHNRHIPDASFLLTGFQYVHWQFDGADLIYAVRAAYRGAADAGRANRYLYGRLTDFAQRCV